MVQQSTVFITTVAIAAATSYAIPLRVRPEPQPFVPPDFQVRRPFRGPGRIIPREVEEIVARESHLHHPIRVPSRVIHREVEEIVARESHLHQPIRAPSRVIHREAEELVARGPRNPVKTAVQESILRRDEEDLVARANGNNLSNLFSISHKLVDGPFSNLLKDHYHHNPHNARDYDEEGLVARGVHAGDYHDIDAREYSLEEFD